MQKCPCMRKTSFALVVVVGTTSIASAQQADVPPPYEEDLANAYSKQGTFEAGGSIGASITSNTSTVTASPTAGYFIADRIELSARFNFAYARTEMDNGLNESAKSGALIFEPSYHLPLSDDLLAVGGVGIGGGYDGSNLDFEVIPVVGLDVVTSRANVITPELRLPILIGDSHGDDGNIGADVGLGIDIGITTTW